MTNTKAFFICFVVPIVLSVILTTIRIGENSGLALIVGLIFCFSFFAPAFYLGTKNKEFREFGLLGAITCMTLFAVSYYLLGSAPILGLK